MMVDRSSAHRPVGTAWFAAGYVVLGCLLHPIPIHAQSIVRGDIGGRVSDASGAPLQDAQVGATEVRTGRVRWTDTSRDGTFRLLSLPTGEYTLRVEALGYRPVSYEGVPIRPGRSMEFQVTLASATPPVNAVDVIPFADLTGTRMSPDGGRWLGESELASTRDVVPDVAEILALSSGWDPQGGAQGLPAALSRVYVDGAPFTPARHPYRASDDLWVFGLPRSGLAQVSLMEAPADVEWAGTAGGQVAVGTRSSSGTPRVSLTGLGSHRSLWKGRAFGGENVNAVSFWGAAAGEIPLSGDSARVSVAAEALSIRTPRRLEVDSGLLSTASAELGGAAGLPPSWTDELEIYTGFARLDWSVGTGTAVLARVNASRGSLDGGRVFATPVWYGTRLSRVETDVSALLSVSTSLGSRFVLEVRGALERSLREYGGAAGESFGSDFASTGVLSENTGLGGSPASDGRVQRNGFVGSGAVHLDLGAHRFKAGGELSLASYEYEVSPPTEGSFFFSDAAGLVAREGAYVGFSGGGALTTFSLPNVGGFLQYQWSASPGVSITSGIRLDREFLPGDRVARNGQWLALTGITNTTVPDALDSWGGRIGVAWDLTGRGSSLVTGSLATQNGRIDPGIIHEVILLDGPVGVARAVGSLGAWPDAPSEGVTGSPLPTLAIMDPGFRAPRTTRGTGAISQSLGPGATFRISGTYRRTEYLPRRTDLNRVILPIATSNLGRPMYGELTKLGSVLQATPGSNRRFPEFDRVWALASDGTSEYVGATLAVEISRPWLDASAEYTISRTRDDWMGAASGVPDAQLTSDLSAGGGTGVWEDGRSDFDIPHRLVLDADLHLALPFVEAVTLGGTLRAESGLPFTPSYALGADVNGDGSSLNDPVLVPDDPDVHALAEEWECLGAWIGQIVERNACRAPAVYTIDLRLAVTFLRLGGVTAELLVEGFDILDAETGPRDPVLLRVDPVNPLTVSGSGVVEIPTVVNPSFGEPIFPTGLGRRVRLGFRVSMP